MRALRPLALLLALPVFAGCGAADPAAAPAPVRLQVEAPASVRDATVEVHGTVRPAGATVLVRGRQAPVNGRTWSAQVDLDPGVNVIDVIATAHQGRPALTAFRVRRVTTVQVPDVTGQTAGDARTQLEDAGLKVDTRRKSDGFFDELLGGDRHVCETDPAAGDEVDLGTTVEVTVARNC